MIICCGNEQFEWDSLTNVMDKLREIAPFQGWSFPSIYEILQSIPRKMYSQRSQYHVKSVSTEPIVDLVLKFSRTVCQDPRD